MIRNSNTHVLNGIKQKRYLKFFLTLIILGLGLVMYSFVIEPSLVKIEYIEIPIANLPPSFNDFKIVQLSDLHYSDLVSSNFIKKSIEKALSLKPDVIVLTGDYISYDSSYFDKLLIELAELKAPHGVFAVLGNHEYYGDTKEIIKGLRNSNIITLVNENKEVTINGQSIWFVGVDDYLEGDSDLEMALKNVPGSSVKILLSHEPDFVEHTIGKGISLQLSGHSHGGQVRIPFIGPLVLPPYGEKYDMGLYKVQDTFLYTNRGLGVTDYSVRFNCRPEITLITLKHQKSNSSTD